ncbi:MAG: alpha/beta hydrolase [Chryseolinea sp.]
MKNVILISIILSGVFAQTSAQDTTVTKKTLTYKRVDGQELNIFMFYSAASQRRNDNVAIALFHGGGWVFGDPAEFFEACKRYARMGYVTFSVDYRLCKKADGSWPNPAITPVESTKDARSAIRWLKSNAAMLKIDPKKIVVGGQSAGGQLALSTVLLDSINEKSDDLKVDPTPAALLLYSPAVNTMEAWIDMLLGSRRTEIWSISPYHHLRKGMPPVIMFRGDEDNQVLPYITQMFKGKMDAVGNYCEEHVYKGRKHYLAEGNKKYATYFDEEILGKTDAFLKKFKL